MIFIPYFVGAVVLCVGAFLGWCYMGDLKSQKEAAKFKRNMDRYSDMTQSERSEFTRGLEIKAAATAVSAEAARLRVDELSFGKKNPHLICPHCQKIGDVRTKGAGKKIGISGGKATAAILTGGASILVTGLSQKKVGTQARCGVCKSTWFF